MKSKRNSIRKEGRSGKEMKATALFGIYLMISLTVFTAYSMNLVSAADTGTPAPKTGVVSSVTKLTSTSVQSSEYYGGLYYFDVRQSNRANSEGYKDAISNWWKAQGSLSKYLVSQFKSMGTAALKGFLINTIFGKKYTKYFSATSPQYWISKGVCYAIKGSAAAAVGLFDNSICDNVGVLLPILTCTVQTYVNTNVIANNVCLPVYAQEMEGIPTGYDNCEKCQEDSFPCTATRCEALSADSECVYNTYSEKCYPDPEAIKNCDKTSGTPLSITQMNNATITSSNQYTKNNITYGDVSFDVEMKTNIASECRYTSNKSVGWANMITMDSDLTYKTHTVSMDISDPTRTNYSYFVLCQDSCRKQIFSQIVEAKLGKASKPDNEGPVIIDKYPLPDLPIEGGLNGKRETTMIIKTDEPSECKYKRWPIAESMESFIGTVEQIEQVASTLVGAGASEETLESELSLTGLDYNDGNLTIMPVSGQYTTTHTINFTGSKALNNGEIYAFVVLCKDANGNVGEIPGVVRFRVSDPFKVTINEPEDTIMEPQPEIGVSTARGSSCGYSIDTKPIYTNMTVFENTGFSSHSTTIEQILSYGQHKLYVTCFDSDNLDIASAEKTFTLLRDNQAPQIVRAYKDSDTLFIATNELTSCQYSIKQFTYGQGSETTENSPNSKTHRMDWIADKVYYIKCKDRFGNEMSSTLRTTRDDTVSV